MMAENTAIEWCDSTFNPWTGCTKVGPGCDHCYAEAWAKRSGTVQWGPHAERRRSSASNWKAPLHWEREHEAFQAQHGRRRRVFCASLADVFDHGAPTDWRRDLFDLVDRTPHLDWLLLTKRIGNARPMLEECYFGRWAEKVRGNIWIGATVVNLEEADRDVPKLLAVPAAVRFLSIEPMLGPIDLERPRPGPNLDQGGGRVICQPWLIQSGIDWVICGGESGPGARPMHPDWARSLRDQCESAGVPFMFKQWGEWLPINQQNEAFTNRLYQSNRKAALHQDQGALDESYGRTCTVPQGIIHYDGSLHDLQEPLAFRAGAGAMQTFKVGKKAAGRLLDGVEHNGFPVTAC
jgi:protein gp37